MFDRAGTTEAPMIGLLSPEQVPLVGRESELSRLVRLLGQGGYYAGALLAGAGGVGRTRLAREVLEALAATHRVVDAGTSMPEAIRRLRQPDPGRRTPVVFVDDAHLLDPASVSLLLEVARHRHARVLVTVDTAVPVPAGVTALWKDDHLHRVELRPLDPVATRRLACSMVSERLAHSSAVRLARLSAGNPALLRELARAAVEQDGLAGSAGGWKLAERVPLSVPLGELIRGRVDRQDPASRSVLELVALVEPAPLGLLEVAFTTELLQRLEEEGLIEVGPADAVGVSHPLVGHLIRRTLPPLRRRAHLRAWLDRYPADGDLRRIIGWRLETGEPVAEADLLRAADEAAAAHDLRAAVRFTAVAWQAFPNLSTAVAYILSLVSTADLAAADEALTAAEAAFPQAAELGVVRARIALLRGDEDPSGPDSGLLGLMAAFFRNEFAPVVALAEPMLADENGADFAEAAAFGTAALLRMGRPEDALALCDRALPAASRASVTALHADWLPQLRAAALQDLGRLVDAVDLLEHAYERAIGEGWMRLEEQLGYALGVALLERGRPRRALELFRFHTDDQFGWPRWHGQVAIRATIALANLGRAGDVAAGSAPAHPAGALARAWPAFLAGDRRQAREVLTAAAGRARAAGAGKDLAMLMHEMARMGMADPSLADGAPQPQGMYLRAKMEYARALAAGDIPRLRQVAADFAGAGADLFAAEAYAELSRLNRAAGRVRAATAAASQARELAGRCPGAITPALLLLESTRPLSLREREIVLLVAQGLSDREIADRLTLSARTVGNHLYRIYRKMGVLNRRALQRVAGS
ncbi:helix-turn-helix transcriptional regulator [Paractinoplanes toevensis]|uniref:helix-turn-helix transcriptional regulator n=1 Tax=Paractinoplanes toevensis TaxID=571911 RepID=UPI001BB43F64|nr:helix-turn-helix transcriptional regulator [Actinoplanes toevensis]